MPVVPWLLLLPPGAAAAPCPPACRAVPAEAAPAGGAEADRHHARPGQRGGGRAAGR